MDCAHTYVQFFWWMVCCFCCCFVVLYFSTSGTLKVDIHLNVILRSKQQSVASCWPSFLILIPLIFARFFKRLFLHVRRDYAIVEMKPQRFFCRQIRLQKWRLYVSEYGKKRKIQNGNRNTWYMCIGLDLDSIPF